MPGWGSYPEYADDEGGEAVIDREKAKEKERQKVDPPKPYQVVMLNDDYTPFDFVEDTLMKYFPENIPTKEVAQRKSFEIHTEGQTICGVYPREIAESKSAVVNDYCIENEHPLKTIIQKAP